MFDCGLRIADCGMIIFRPISSLINPGFDQSDLIRLQSLAIDRHARLTADSGDALIERALVRSARNDDFGQGDLFRVETQPGHLFIRAVAAVAMRLKDRLYPPGEIDFQLLTWIRRGER